MPLPSPRTVAAAFVLGLLVFASAGAQQRRFQVEVRHTLEVVLQTGQKIQFDHQARQIVQRPDRMRAERVGDLVAQVFVYDGQSLTLFDPAKQVYAGVPAPARFEEMLEFAPTTRLRDRAAAVKARAARHTFQKQSRSTP